jgi:putative peptidoglycan lipid II flippase
MPSSASSTAKATRPLQAVLILGALYFLARFTGLFQRLIISALLPIGANDAYNYAFKLPDFLNQMVAGGAISLTFIPIFAQFWNREQRDEAWRFFSTLTSVMSVVLVVLTATMMLFTPQLLAWSFPGLLEPEKAETYRLATQMTRIILPAQLFFYLGGLLVGVLNTFKRFGATGWTSALNNVVAIAVGVALWSFMGPIGFAWGILLGAFCGNFLLPLLAAQSAPRAEQPRFHFRFTLRDPDVRRFFLLALPIMLGVSLPVVDQLVVTRFASLLPEGPVTYLENANRLMIAAQGVLGQAAAVAAFPYLAAQVANGDYPAFAEFLRSGLRRLLFVALPVSTLMIVWATPLTRLMFGYGLYNTPQNLRETAICLAFYCVGLFAWVAQGLVARGFYALGDTRTPTILGTLLTFLFFVPLCALMGRFYGAAGLAFSTSIGAGAYFISILLMLDKKMSQKPLNTPLGLEKIASTLLRTGLACFLMGILGVLALKSGAMLFPDDKLGDVFNLLWSGAIAIATFIFAATRFRIAEWSWLRSKIQRRKHA